MASAGAPADKAALTKSDEIVVTGERVKRSLRDTASSVSVISGRQIEAASADRVEQMLAMLPNVQLGSGSEGPTIRGQDTTGVLRDLPAFLGGNRPRTTLIVDGRAVSYNEFVFGAAPLWDVERIEVFRSPQTTTQGRNSIAGAIFVETADPVFEWGGKARAIAGDFRTRQISGAVTGPLNGDVALRLAGDLRRSRTASLITSTARGGPDPNSDVYGLIRAKLLARPTSLPGSRLLVTYVHTGAHNPQFEGVRAPFHERRDPDATYGIFRTNVDSVTVRGSAALAEGLALDSTLSFADAKIRRFAPPGLGETRIRARDWSGEAIANWKPAGSFGLLGGVSTLRAKLDQAIDLSAVRLGSGSFDDVQTSLGVFGEAEWRPSRRSKVVGGLRYQRDRQNRAGSLGSAGLPIVLDYDRSFDAWLPKLSLEYELTQTLRAGVLVQRAFNPGGTAINLATRSPDEFEAETLWAYELFARLTAPQSRLSASANLFYYDIHNAQRPLNRSIVTPTGTANFAEIDNAPQARSYGLEAEARWAATEELSVTGGLGLLRTKILRTLTDPDPLLGKQFQRAPKITASAAVDLRPLRSLTLSAQIRHNSGYFSDDAETRAFRVGGSTIVNGRAAWERGGFTMFAYARNVTNAFDLTYILPAASGVASRGTAVDPRELGLGIEGRF